MVKNNDTIKWRVGQLEKCLDQVDIKVDQILSNHLPHIQQQVEANRTTLKIATAVNVGAIICGIILSKFI